MGWGLRKFIDFLLQFVLDSRYNWNNLNVQGETHPVTVY